MARIIGLYLLRCAALTILFDVSQGAPAAAPTPALTAPPTVANNMFDDLGDVAPDAAHQEIECRAAALTDYTRAEMVLLNKPGLRESVGTIIGTRRLQELYCLRVARCQITRSPPLSPIGSEIGFNSAFAACLHSEAVNETSVQIPGDDDQ
jgi:hypothetical protein